MQPYKLLERSKGKIKEREGRGYFDIENEIQIKDNTNTEKWKRSLLTGHVGELKDIQMRKSQEDSLTWMDRKRRTLRRIDMVGSLYLF